MLNQPKQLFKWQGERSGQASAGMMQASNKIAVKIELIKQGIKPHKISKLHRTRFSFAHQAISAQDILLFTKQLTTLQQAGISLTQALDIIIKNQPKQSVIILLNTIRQCILTGFSLSESLAHHPRYFSATYINLLAAGERSGTLAQMLCKIEDSLQYQLHTKHKIKKALTYPVLVLIISTMATVSLLLYVVPQFVDLFNNFNAELPAFTQGIIALSQGLRAHGIQIILGCLILVSCSYLFYKHTTIVPIFMERVVLAFPILGRLIQQIYIARYCATLSAMLATNIPYLESLHFAAASTGSKLHLRANQTITNNLANGQPLGFALASIKLFPAMVTQLITLGEETGMLTSLLSHLVDYYDKLIQTTIDSLTRLIEPCLMVLLGFIIGILVLSMYLPLFKLGTVI